MVNQVQECCCESRRRRLEGDIGGCFPGAAFIFFIFLLLLWWKAAYRDGERGRAGVLIGRRYDERWRTAARGLD